jgi:hypothetical protein
MVCSIGLNPGLAENPVARQMRHSLLDYMASSKFKPTVELTQAQISGLVAGN